MGGKRSKKNNDTFKGKEKRCGIQEAKKRKHLHWFETVAYVFLKAHKPDPRIKFGSSSRKPSLIVKEGASNIHGKYAKTSTMKIPAKTAKKTT